MFGEKEGQNDVPKPEKSACWGEQFMGMGINILVPSSEPELPGRWEGAVRFQGGDGKGEFWLSGQWDGQGMSSEAAGTRSLLIPLLQHRLSLHL